MDRAALLERFRTGSADVDDAVAGIDGAELDRAPDDGGWTARQVIHHLADSEAMAYTRIRRLVADEAPEIQAYDEPRWAERLHYERPVATPLAVLYAVRAASLALLEALTPEEWERRGTHTESGVYGVDDWLRIYSAHAHEHAAQIRAARGWR